MNKSLIGERIKNERLRLGLTQDEAAQKCNVRRETWGRYERGQLEPGSQVIQDFVMAGADESYILLGMKKDIAINLVETFLDVRKKQLRPLLDKIERSCINSEDEDVELVAQVAQHLRNTRLASKPELSRANAIKRLLAMSDEDFFLMTKL